MHPAHPFEKESTAVPPALDTSKQTTQKATGNPFASSIRKTRLRQVGVAITVFLLLFISVGYYIYLNNRGGILILDKSSDLSVSLNGTDTRTSLTSKGSFIRVYPGEYRVTLTKPHYLPFTIDINLAKGQTVAIRPAYAIVPTAEQAAQSTIDFVRPAADQKSVFYLGNKRSTIHRFELSSNSPAPLTNSPLQAVSDVQWSSDPTVALITQSDGVYLHEIPKYDFQNQILLRLGGNELISPIWDPNNPGRIAFAYAPASGEHSLVFADKRLATLERKADIAAIANPKLVWSSNDAYIALIARSSDSYLNNVWIYTTANGNLEQLTTVGDVTNASFSPNSDILLYETSDGLSVIKVGSNQAKSLGVKGQVAKAAWRDNSSFFLPNPSRNSLSIFSLDGSSKDIPFSFADTLAIQGMYYYNQNNTLIFFTNTTIYTVSLST